MLLKILISIALMTVLGAGPCPANELYDELLALVRSKNTQYDIDQFVRKYHNAVVEGVGYVASIEKQKNEYFEGSFLMRVNDKPDSSDIYSELSIKFLFFGKARRVIESLKVNQKIRFKGDLADVKYGVIKIAGKVRVEPLD
ncbi:MAG: hypothetical protein HQL30_10015 [Candidatus Omnitrophica bacterium]|nr:hypothetical protein [Candidatus Omnitrophota bacterium]